MYTPFRRKPRIFPAVVSATVLSEAITLLFPQLVAANALGEASGLRCASALRDKMAEPANPAPAVATLQRNERRSLEQGASWRLVVFRQRHCSCILIVPFPHPSASKTQVQA